MNTSFIPSKKHIKWTPFVVDAFSYGPLNGIKGYFLRYVMLLIDHFYSYK